MKSWRADEADVQSLVAARHGDPFSLLGLQETPDGLAVRAFVPDAEAVEIVGLDGARITVLERRGHTDFFEALVGARRQRFPYRVKARNAGGEWVFADPYAFGPILGPMDDYLLVEGTHRQLYERLGAHPMRHENVEGVHFAVWAPDALRVSVVGDFNAWDGRRHQMRKRIDSGLWEIFAPALAEGTMYKFEIVGPDGVVLPLKADPFGFGSEMRPSTASVVTRTDNFSWNDDDYLEARSKGDPRRKPMSTYEVHLASWQKNDGWKFLTYDELADRLVPYAVEMGFTHIELMPVSEHPLDASWGYQPIGLFAPTRRHGDPAGFARFVDRAHQAGLGIILDWVPAHFPTDQHGLAHFDGKPLYEHSDPRRGFHPDWNTAIYDFGRREVANFLSASALYWLDRYHVDGLRVDAVASMLYLDYSRKPGEWLPNPDGSNQNNDAVAFLQRVNKLAYGEHPGTTTIAEESTSWPGVSQPVHSGGLGFGFKWNMGWMHDTLDYMSLDPVYRRYHHDKLTFGLLYAFSENFVLPLSHDEVVHGKRSILGRMPGDEWQQFANLRAYYGLMWGHPGKKLLFMGQEFGQRNEWNFDQSLEWHLLDYPLHAGVKDFVRDLNRAYRERPALHARDCEGDGFRWVVADDKDQSVYAFLRFGGPDDRPIVVICNFTPIVRYGYRIGLPHAGRWREVLNSDASIYGGSGLGNLGAVEASALPAHGLPASADLILPPLSTLFLEYDPAAKADLIQ
ncbi:1,4-alpha-glucan branching protein GlgB [Kaistia dalseonensis]|uniref:1,4-alpha-glucan branching enzyme GlgB n=1 Tax=Kaistia dalseonensis TaxID=410840 RepID=A0ABU0H8F8_9HYPH|nr:1,4-alpha-glucan branching protein GlgB [Kaistia dalseonensis]MCX5495967.1 1,4-alpha-glucan branching protein GlgB [Kaistia dalseonensis]MDQ0438570.1 1,4-alpha-glucan branching enzyme [Kaistia dalseonensis]